MSYIAYVILGCAGVLGFPWLVSLLTYAGDTYDGVKFAITADLILLFLSGIIFCFWKAGLV